MGITTDWDVKYISDSKSIELDLVEKEAKEDRVIVDTQKDEAEPVTKIVKSIIETNREKIFRFDLKRSKSTVSKKERLMITTQYVKESPEECWGTLTVHPDKLRDEFLTIKEYGVVLPRKLYGDICKLIELNYIFIPYDTSDLADEPTEEDLKGIVGVCCKHIAEKDPIDYNIPVKEFEALIKASDYKRLDLTLVRDGLRDFGYTKCNPSRNDLTVNGVGKVISIISDNDYVVTSITKITEQSKDIS